MVLLPIVVGIGLVQWAIRRLFFLARRSQEQLGEISEHVLGSLQGMAAIQGFVAEEAFVERFEARNLEWLRTGMQLAVIRSTRSAAAGACGWGRDVRADRGRRADGVGRHPDRRRAGGLHRAADGLSAAAAFDGLDDVGDPARARGARDGSSSSWMRRSIVRRAMPELSWTAARDRPSSSATSTSPTRTNRSELVLDGLTRDDPRRSRGRSLRAHRQRQEHAVASAGTALQPTAGDDLRRRRRSRDPRSRELAATAGGGAAATLSLFGHHRLQRRPRGGARRWRRFERGRDGGPRGRSRIAPGRSRDRGRRARHHALRRPAAAGRAGARSLPGWRSPDPRRCPVGGRPPHRGPARGDGGRSGPPAGGADGPDLEPPAVGPAPLRHACSCSTAADWSTAAPHRSWSNDRGSTATPGWCRASAQRPRTRRRRDRDLDAAPAVAVSPTRRLGLRAGARADPGHRRSQPGPALAAEEGHRRPRRARRGRGSDGARVRRISARWSPAICSRAAMCWRWRGAVSAASFGLRSGIYRKLLGLRQSYLDRQPAGRLMTRATSDVDALGEAFSSGLINIILDLLMIVGTLVAMFLLDARLTLVLLLLAPPMLAVLEFIRRRLRALFLEVREALASVNAFLAERVDGVEVVQLFGNEEHSETLRCPQRPFPPRDHPLQRLRLVHVRAGRRHGLDLRRGHALVRLGTGVADGFAAAADGTVERGSAGGLHRVSRPALPAVARAVVQGRGAAAGRGGAGEDPRAPGCRRDGVRRGRSQTGGRRRDRDARRLLPLPARRRGRSAAGSISR